MVMFGCLPGLGAVIVEMSCHVGELADNRTDLTGLLAALYRQESGRNAVRAFRSA